MAQTYQFGGLEVIGFAPRQAQALALTAQGQSSKEAARTMGISPRTVEMNLCHAMERFGARNRVHLITQAFACGALRTRAIALLFAFLALFALVPQHSDHQTIARHRPAHRHQPRGGKGRRRDDEFDLFDNLLGDIA